ncbi:MAG: corrinoid protein [Emergencia sp.]|nr:corrinoid protein [Emergencia sp.]
MLLEEMKRAVMEGDDEGVITYVKAAIAQSIDPVEILEQGLVPGMDEVGQRFKTGNMFVPEVLMAANAMQAGNDLLKPLMVGNARKTKGKIVIGTVEGDLHDIGKKIVGMMLEGAGYEVIDLGIDVKPERFIGALEESQADAVGMSAMLTTTMTVMKEVAETVHKDERFRNVKVMIGGAPVTAAYAEQIGAKFSYDAPSAVELANTLMG